ncbi:MAG: hypothetical protein F4091_03495 [Acidimicrobiales bacterium]|nr:hypothetical protein [Acidimicrobiales bacterium]MYD84249.1 hypothetical protein [Acidimicrobiales bacterium]MYJ64516.1 hypothetical protein [Acidimicrobiales bacterium]
MFGDSQPARRRLAITIAALTCATASAACATGSGYPASVGGHDHGGDGYLECQAHTGPEPAVLLDWRTDPDEPHPEVSCVVGTGIRAGWWQWHEFSASDCTYVAVLLADGVDDDGNPSWSRRNAIEPVQLREGDLVIGYATADVGNWGPISGTSRAECFLEYLGDYLEDPR